MMVYVTMFVLALWLKGHEAHANHSTGISTAMTSAYHPNIIALLLGGGLGSCVPDLPHDVLDRQTTFAKHWTASNYQVKTLLWVTVTLFTLDL